MNKKRKDYKVRLLISTIGTLIVMVILFLFSFGFLASITVSGFLRDCSAYDKTAASAARIAEQRIAEKGKLLVSYKEVIKAQNSWTEGSILTILRSMSHQNEFQYLAFVDMAGNVLSSSEKADTGKMIEFAESVMNGGNEVKIAGGEDQSCLYGIQVNRGGLKKGVLVGAVNAKLEESWFGTAFVQDKVMIYVLDECDRVLFYAGVLESDFQKSSLSEGDYFNTWIMRREEHKIAGGVLNPAFLIQAVKDTILLYENNAYLWYDKEMDCLSGEGSFILGKAAVLSPDSKNILFHVGTMLAFMLIISFILMLVLIITQGISACRIEKAAYKDPVTGYSNWSRFEVDAAYYLHKRKSREYAVISLDIRKFRLISEMRGYERTDEVIRQFASVLHKELGKKECFGRYAVEDFAMLLSYTSQEELEARIMNLDGILKQLVDVMYIKFAYGIYYITDYGMNLQRMYNYASIAKERTKKSNEGCMAVFSDYMRDEMLREQMLENHMEKALTNHEFVVYLQPKYSLENRALAGAEALVRWISPELGFISPGDFIPLFEKNGFIARLDEYMLEAVCVKQKEWQDIGAELITISVNISRAHLLEQDLTQKIADIVKRYEIPFSAIELELTESAFFDHKDILLQTVRELREYGFLVSMDDFGAGYSSLNSLKDLPLDFIKLDAEFFRETERKERGEIVIRDTISLAKHLNMKVVAEGIETKEQVQFLEQIGCDLVQGYYFAKPMPLEEFEKQIGYVSNQETNISS